MFSYHIIFLLSAVTLFNGFCVSGRTVDITWTVQAVQQYTIQNPLQVNQGDILRFHCTNSYSNVFYLVSEEQYTNCNGSVDNFAYQGPCFTSDGGNKVISLEVTENAQVLSSATQFESGRQYYFASFSQSRTTRSSFDASTVTAGECAEGLRMAIAVEPPVTTTTSELPGPSITPGTAPSITPGTAPSNTPGTGGLGSQLSTMDYIIIGVVLVVAITLLFAFIFVGCLCWHMFCKNKNKKHTSSEAIGDGEMGVYTPTKKEDLSDGDSSSHKHSPSKKIDRADGVGENRGKRKVGDKTDSNGVQKPTKPESDKGTKKGAGQKKTTQSLTSNGVKPGEVDAERKSSDSDKKTHSRVAQQPPGNSSSSQKPTKTGSTDKGSGKPESDKETKKGAGQKKTTQSSTSNGVKPGEVDAERKSRGSDKKTHSRVAQQPPGNSSSSQKLTKIGSTEKGGGGNKVTPKPLTEGNKPSPRLSSVSAAKNESRNASQVKGGHRATYSGEGVGRAAPSRPAPSAPKKDSVSNKQTSNSTAQSRTTTKGQSSHQTVDATVSLPVGTKTKQQSECQTVSVTNQQVKYTATKFRGNV